MKRLNNNSNSEVPKRKERHIVSWSKEEDDVLREQISIHGTENWAIIASNFKDKTTRQCRRRWFTYLNSDFKKGGWSPEEDMLLCEAQKMFGNRWTEIAKVVSGRTDNAVKNRFTTLCKKRAKQKENSTTSYINLNNKRVLFLNERSESTGSLKKLRTYTSNTTENLNQKEHLLRPPFAVLAENIHSCEVNKMQGTFLKKDDPKVVALLQQAELLSSLAIKVNSGKTEHSLESAWTVLQDFLKENKENKESDQLTSENPDNGFQFEKFKELVEDLRSTNEGNKPSWREPDIYESSPDSSEYSTGSTLLSNVSAYKTEDCLSEENRFYHTTSKNEAKKDIEANKEALCEFSNKEFSSPLHVTPFFRSLAATIPSPKFSESEKHFLMKTLGMESNSPSPITNPSQPPPCKRSLLHCL